MKVTRILAALLLLAVVAGAASAQEVTRLSWNSCDPQFPNQNWAGPAIYKLVYSGTNWSGSYAGHDTRLAIGPAFPLADAWRFDDAGCQTATQIAFSFAPFAKACPSLQGTAPLAITNYGLFANGGGDVRIANTFNEFFPSSSSARLTVWVISFDHTYSVTGPTNPGVDCGGALQPENFHAETEFLHQDGHISNGVGAERDATWQGGVVAAQPSSWGQVKGLYR